MGIHNDIGLREGVTDIIQKRSRQNIPVSYRVGYQNFSWDLNEVK